MREGGGRARGSRSAAAGGEQLGGGGRVAGRRDRVVRRRPAGQRPGDRDRAARAAPAGRCPARWTARRTAATARARASAAASGAATGTGRVEPGASARVAARRPRARSRVAVPAGRARRARAARQGRSGRAPAAAPAQASTEQPARSGTARRVVGAPTVWAAGRGARSRRPPDARPMREHDIVRETVGGRHGPDRPDDPARSTAEEDVWSSTSWWRSPRESATSTRSTTSPAGCGWTGRCSPRPSTRPTTASSRTPSARTATRSTPW